MGRTALPKSDGRGTHGDGIGIASRRPLSARVSGAWLLALTVWCAFGCGGDDSLIGQFTPNAHPDTDVTATPPVLSETSFEVEFFWTGRDHDGEVKAFEWRVSDNGGDGMIDVEDTLSSLLPWAWTQQTDSTFVVSAELDSFAADLGSDIPDSLRTANGIRFWQTHTFFVRAVDDRGARDATPAMVSFTATTVAPTVDINFPKTQARIDCTPSPLALTFGWKGRDPDTLDEEPAFVRHILIPVSTRRECILQFQFEQNPGAYIRTDDRDWSPWLPYDGPDGIGRRVTYERKPNDSSYLFVVQAMDVAGAVTPSFQWNRNVRHVRTDATLVPLLTVCDKFLGCKDFVGRNQIASFSIVSGQELVFSWAGDATAYSGFIEAYRYGWDLVDPDDENDPGWAGPWGSGPAWQRATARTWTQGSHNFVAQCRDNSGTITRAFYQFEIIQIPIRPPRNLLLVDDFAHSNKPEDLALEAKWDAVWKDMLIGKVPGFQDADILDTQTDWNRMGFATLADYRTVIWMTNNASGTYFHREIAPDGLRLPKYNWVEVYQSRVGSLLFCGPGAMSNSIESSLDPDYPQLKFPYVYNVRGDPREGTGFGEDTRPDGTKFNRGTTRWPYSAWCLEATDIVRPPVGLIWGEANDLLRSTRCDGIARAVVADEFVQEFPSAREQVTDLRPNRARVVRDSKYALQSEEFYNFNASRRRITLIPRDCQVAMFRMRARVDEGLLSECEDGQPPSVLYDAPIAMASSVYSDTKILRGARDFVWGFHPMGFEQEDVENALLWILESQWELPVNR